MANTGAPDPTLRRITDIINHAISDENAARSVANAFQYYQKAGDMPFKGIDANVWKTGLTSEIERLVTQNADVVQVLSDVAAIQERLDGLFKSKAPKGILGINPIVKLPPNVYKVIYFVWEATQLFFEPAPTGTPAPTNAIGSRRGEATIGRCQASVQMKVESLNGSRGQREWAWHMREIVNAIAYYIALNTVIIYMRQNSIIDIVNRDFLDASDPHLNGSNDQQRCYNMFGAVNRGPGPTAAALTFVREKHAIVNPNATLDTEICTQEMYSAARLHPTTAQNILEGHGDGMDQAKQVSDFPSMRRVVLRPLLTKDKTDVTSRHVCVPLYNVCASNNVGPAGIQYNNWKTGQMQTESMQDIIKKTPFFKQADDLPGYGLEQDIPVNVRNNEYDAEESYTPVAFRFPVCLSHDAETIMQKATRVCHLQGLNIKQFLQSVSCAVAKTEGLVTYIMEGRKDDLPDKYRMLLGPLLNDHYRNQVVAFTAARNAELRDSRIPLLMHLAEYFQNDRRMLAATLFFALLPLRSNVLLVLDSAGYDTFLPIMLLRRVEFSTSGVILMQSGDSATHYVNNLGVSNETSQNTQERTVLMYFYWALVVKAPELIINVHDLYIRYCSRCSSDFMTEEDLEKGLDLEVIASGKILAYPAPGAENLINHTVVSTSNKGRSEIKSVDDIVEEFAKACAVAPTHSIHPFDIVRAGGAKYYEFERATQYNLNMETKKAEYACTNGGRLGDLDTPSGSRLAIRQFDTTAHDYDMRIALTQRRDAIATY